MTHKEWCSDCGIYILENVVLFRAGKRNLSFLKRIQTGCEVHQLSYSMNQIGYFQADV
jgi:hypothetical protein